MEYEKELLPKVQKQSKRYFVVNIIISILIGSFLYIQKANKKMKVDAIAKHLRERVQEELAQARNK